MISPSPVLADPIQIAVMKGQPPVQVCPPVGGSVLIYNPDLTNVVNVGYRTNIGSTNSLPVQPLGSATLDGSRAIYAFLPSSATVNTVTLCVAPGGTNISPSPAQISAQISALGLAKESTQQLVEGNTGNTVTGLGTVNSTLGTPAQDPTVGGLNTGIPNNIFGTGVPLYGKRQQVFSTTNHTLSVAGVFSSGTIAVSQIGYDIYLQLKCSATETVASQFLVTILWIDSATGINVDEQVYILAGDSVSGAAFIFHGPVEADQVNVSVINNGTKAATIVSGVMVVNSLPYSWHDAYSLDQSGALSNPVNTLTNYFVPGSIIASSSITIAASGSATRLLPLYVGVCSFRLPSGTGNVQIQSTDTNNAPPNSVMFQFSLLSTPQQVDVTLGRSQSLIVINNTGAASAVFNLFGTAKGQPAGW